MLELDPARKKPAASISASLLSRTRINIDQLRASSPSIWQLLQAEVKTHCELDAVSIWRTMDKLVALSGATCKWIQ